MIRSLLYRCTATSWSDEWKLNIDRLIEFSSVFTGRKIVVNIVGAGLRSPEEVEAYFSPLGSVEFIHVPNDLKTYEGCGFHLGLKSLAVEDTGGCTFYAHTRGVRYTTKLGEPFLQAIRDWRNTCYTKALSDVAKIEGILKDHACCGSYRVTEPNRVFQGAKFFFFGNFWWVRNDKLFATKDWDKDRVINPFSVEAYLGQLFSVDESFCLFEDDYRGDPYAAELEYRCECGYTDKRLSKIGAMDKILCPECKNFSALSSLPQRSMPERLGVMPVL